MLINLFFIATVPLNQWKILSFINLMDWTVWGRHVITDFFRASFVRFYYPPAEPWSSSCVLRLVRFELSGFWGLSTWFELFLKMIASFKTLYTKYIDAPGVTLTQCTRQATKVFDNSQFRLSMAPHSGPQSGSNRII